MNKIKLFLVLIFSLSVFAVNAQQRSFSQNPEVFIDELVNHMSSLGQDYVANEATKFKAFWAEGKLNESEKRAIRDICEDMLFKKLAVQPYFELFISTINYYFANDIDKKVLTQWQEISIDLLDKKPKEYLAFLQTANQLFGRNVLYSRDQQTWYADNNKFEFIYDGRIAIKFNYLNLTSDGPLDKIKIYDTKGVFYTDKSQWVGEGGTVNWERVGFSEEEVKAKLESYEINLSGSKYTAENVTLIAPKYFKGGVKGRLTDQLSFSTSLEQIQNSNYPSFTSYESEVDIDGLVGDMAEYKGGFTLQGYDVTGDNIQNMPATITLFYNNEPKVILKSYAFRIKDDVVVSRNSSVEILVDSTKSIFHPAVMIRYDFGKKEFTVDKGSDGLMLMSFQDDYHGIEIDADKVFWKQTTAEFEFRSSSPDKPLRLESNNYFREANYDKVKGILSYNPLNRMRQYSLKYKISKFHLEDYCAEYGSKKANIINQIISLTDGGFIYYDKTTDTIELRKKLYNYVANHQKFRDYDIIKMSSIISARPNLTYNASNSTLRVEGVRNFIISDSQNCIAVPHEQQIIIKKDRDMNFGGMVRAGKVDFYSKDFNFKYQAFQISNTNFDSMVLYYPDGDSRKLRKVQSVLTDLFGTLEFDYPTNKSGLKKKDYPEYPIFTSEYGSKVHYEYARTHNYIYKKDKFYFEVDPFRITNLNDFTAEDLTLPGTFVSDDIFPDFRYELSIQPDYSLGFVKNVDLPMYRNSGKGDMEISLSNRGLYGEGSVEYQTSISKSPEFLLLPEQALANSKTFDLPESATYPLVSGIDVSTDWRPYEKTMYVSHNAEKFDVFKMKYKFGGTLALSPSALSGDGQLEWDEAEFYSKNMVYGKNRVDADTSGIKIYAFDSTTFAFETDNVEGHLDFDKRHGHFIANNPHGYTYLPVNRYATTLSDYTWKMDEKQIEMKQNEKFPNIDPFFISTKPEQDSLKYGSEYANFDMVDYVVDIEKIPFIDVADSRILLADGKAVVRKDADMDVLDSTTIIANRIDKYHKIYDTRTKIFGKNNIRASGLYDYSTKLGEQHIINMDSIKISRDKILVGVGYIPDSQSYFLDVQIGYKGWAKILSTEKEIDYTGYVKPILSMDYVSGQWLRYAGKVDVQDVVIDVLAPKNVDNRPLRTGLFVAGDSVRVYPMLFGMKQGYSNPEITLDSGVFYYDHDAKEIVVGDKAKLFYKEPKGNVIRVNDKARTIKTEGQFALDLKVKKGIKTGFSGNSLWKEGDTTYTFDWTYFIDFPLPKEAVSRIVEIAQNDDYGAQIDLKSSELVANMYEFYDKESNAKTVVNRIINNGSLNSENVVATSQFFQSAGKAKDKIREVFDPNLYIKEVENRAPEKAQFFVTKSNWYFDNRLNSFIANGGFNLASINGVNINKEFKSVVVVEKKRSGDNIHLYIEFSPNEYIYFYYVRGIMYAYSSDKDFNDIIIDKGEKISNDDYSLRRGTPRSVDKFLDKFE